jgi:LysM repeat protein
MNDPEPRNSSFDRWRRNLALTAAVMVTVMMALVLAQLDALSMRMPGGRGVLPIVNAQATAIADGSVITLTYGSAAGMPIALMPDLNPRPDIPIANPLVVQEPPVVCGEVPEGWILYTVQESDTLETLSAGTGVSVGTLVEANCLAEPQVTTGMQILLPGQPAPTPIPAAACGPPQWWVRYQVRSGDTLSLLAVLRGTTVQEILTANCRDSLDLTAGQFIFLPPGGGPIAPQPTAVPPTATAPLPTTAPGVPTAVPTGERPPTRVPPTLEPTLPATAVPTRPGTTPVPTATPPFFPTATRPGLTPTPPPTATPPPPTATPRPTNTAVPPTNTPPPPPTDTPPPPPTDTPPPPPTDTPPPPPTDTPPPPPTDTPPPPPTDTPPPPPTDTPPDPTDVP